MCTELSDIDIARRMISKAANAKERNIDFSLSFTSFKNLMRAKRCYFTGIELKRAVGGVQHADTLTIDRIDSSKGYVKGNVVACCYAFNQAKANMEKNCSVVPNVLIAKGMRKLFGIKKPK